MLGAFFLFSASPAMTAPSSPLAALSREYLENGDFQQWEEGKPLGWSTGAKEAYSPDPTMAGQSSQALRIEALPPEEGEKKGPLTLTQSVRLDPERDYALSLRTAQSGNGTTLIRIHALENNKVSGEAVLEWNNHWSSGYPWHPLTLKFRTGMEDHYRITIIHHAKAGDALWLEGVSLRTVEPEGSDVPFVLTTRSIMLPPGEAMEAETEATQLLLRGCPGEFEPGQLVIKAGKALKTVELRAEGALTGPDGATIPADAVTIRMTAEQALLPLARPRALQAGETLGWWVTVRLPGTAKAGSYRGMLKVIEAGQTLRQLPLIVEVEPFTLPEPKIAMFVYHNERYFPKGGFLNAELRSAYYRDMKEHGMNTVTVYNNPDVDGKAIDLDHDRSWLIKPERIAEMNKRGYLLDEQEVSERYRFGLRPVMELIHRSGLVAPQQPILLLAHKAGIYNWGGIPSEALKAMMDEWLPQWPKPLYYVNDEVEGHPDRIEAARKVFDRLKELDLPLTTVSANIAVKELGHDYNVWIQLEKRITPEMKQFAKEYQAQLWAYNCNMHAENTQLTRALFGLWAYRSGVEGVGLWAYYDAMNWYADRDGKIHGTNGRFSLARVCPSPDGPIPTVSWETTREGVKDYRYAMLFDDLLARLEKEAGRSGLAQARKEQLATLLDTTRRVRKSLIDSIPFDAMAPIGSSPYGAAISAFIPVLGMGDARLVSEQKRAGLAAAIRAMTAALETEKP